MLGPCDQHRRQLALFDGRVVREHTDWFRGGIAFRRAVDGHTERRIFDRVVGVVRRDRGVELLEHVDRHRRRSGLCVVSPAAVVHGIGERHGAEEVARRHELEAAIRRHVERSSVGRIESAHGIDGQPVAVIIVVISEDTRVGHIEAAVFDDVVRVVDDDGLIVHWRDDDGRRRQLRVEPAVGGDVDEAVRTVEVLVWCVDEAAVGLQGENAVHHVANQHGG